MKAKNDKQRKLKEDIGKWSAFYRENPHCLAVDYSSPIVNINILFSYFQTFHYNGTGGIELIKSTSCFSIDLIFSGFIFGKSDTFRNKQIFRKR